MTSTHAASIHTAAPAATGTRVMAAAMAAALGLFIVGMVGFSPIEAIHNAAHDTRHANAFPCH